MGFGKFLLFFFFNIFKSPYYLSYPMVFIYCARRVFKPYILSSVIIVKLPFPLRAELLEQKKKECDSVPEFVQKYAVPQMVIKLRQGAGRLIRSETDTSIIAILDSRAAKGSRHRNRVLKALNKYPLVNTIDELEAFIRSVKPDEYWQSDHNTTEGE